jgi:hypothetical protein
LRQGAKQHLSILPETGKPWKIDNLSEREGLELADALLENTNVTYLEFETAKNRYMKSSAEAMAKYVRTSKHLQHIRWHMNSSTDDRLLRLREEILCCFLPAIQESTSLKELHMELPAIGGPSNLALENMLTHTQSLRSLSLVCPVGALEDIAVAATQSGLKKNTTLREFTLNFSYSATTDVSPILTSLRDHPLLRRLCFDGDVRDLTGLDTLLLSDTSKITELEIRRSSVGPHIMGLAYVLEALARHPTLTKLGLRHCHCHLGRDNARLLRIALCNIPRLQSLDLSRNDLGRAELAEIAPALYHNASIKVLDMSGNRLNGMESATLLRDILRSNKTMTALHLSWNNFEETTGAVECIADGLGSNSTLLKLDLSANHL